jgi:hypothetical protein
VAAERNALKEYIMPNQRREGKAISQGSPACSAKSTTKVLLVVTLSRSQEGVLEGGAQILAFLICALGRGERSASHSGHFIAGERATGTQMARTPGGALSKKSP